MELMNLYMFKLENVLFSKSRQNNMYYLPWSKTMSIMVTQK
jgi:hypothetical protein